MLVGHSTDHFLKSVSRSVKIETALLLGNFTCFVARYCTIGLLFSGLCRGRLDCWVADVSVAMLLSPSELVSNVLDYLYR
jgi:hypothetical protein